MAQSQQENQRPPSYTMDDRAAVPAYPPAPAHQTVPMYMPGAPVPQQGYIIQNVPVAPQTGCCGGRAESFRYPAGVSTGTIQMVIGVVAIILDSLTFVLIKDPTYTQFPGMGAVIGASIFFFVPAGILGVLTKSKNNCVIVGYLVMSILSAVQAFFVTGVEGAAAAFRSYEERCPTYPEYFDDVRVDSVYDALPMDAVRPRIAIDYACTYEMVTSVFVLHVVVSVLCFIEFIVAVVAAAYCCGGLRCCCAKPPQQQRPTMMYYTPIGQAPPITDQMQGQVTQDADPIPAKA